MFTRGQCSVYHRTFRYHGYVLVAYLRGGGNEVVDIQSCRKPTSDVKAYFTTNSQLYLACIVLIFFLTNKYAYKLICYHTINVF